jgi:arylsulfatase A
MTFRLQEKIMNAWPYSTGCILLVFLVFACKTTVTTRPNIILILADDLGYGDVGCYGQLKIQTPNIDKLAAHGMRFTQYYSGGTVCAPARSTLMTGLHGGHTPIRGNFEVYPEGQLPLPDSSFTLAELLKRAGYATGAFGKWALGYPHSEGDPLKQGFDKFFGYNCQRLAHSYYPTFLRSDNDSIPLPENQGEARGTYAPTLIHAKALEFIEQQKERPFFLYIPTILPHAELAAPQPNMAKYEGKLGAEKPFNRVDGGLMIKQGAYESQKEPHAAFAAMIDLLDEQVGELVQKLEELNLADNTIIIFTSDNGPHQEGGADPDYFDSNGPLRGYKRDLYEGGIRVPMIVSWPAKINRGAISHHVSCSYDLLSTLAEVVKQSVPSHHQDGISFLPILQGHDTKQQTHPYLYWEFHEQGGKVAVRMGDWKGVKKNVLQNPDAPLELYNLANDIGEQYNVATDFPIVANDIKKIMRSARTPSRFFEFANTARVK